MPVGSRLCHSTPLRLIRAVHDRRWIGKGESRERLRIAHQGFDYPLGCRIAKVVFLPCQIADSIKLAIGQTDMEIESQRPSGTRHYRFTRLTAVGAANQFA